MATALPDSGDLFEGKYRIEREIGSGGFSAVYRATDEATDRVVAIKVLVPLDHETDYSERLVARFEREARLLAGLRSAHTVTMYEFGRSSTGLLFLVFEYVDGTTLRDLVRVKGAQPAERVVAILRQVCVALHEAHSLGVLHRDIKPANIMVYDHLEMRDVVKLLDFGIAKSMSTHDEADETITTAGAVLGTPRYMSPEQFGSQDLTPASDIYSLGLVAYELLTGQQAVDEESVTGVLRAQMSPEGVTFPGGLLVPTGLRGVVEKMAQKKRSDRYQDLAAVLRDLDHWDEGEVGGIGWFGAVGLFAGAALLVAAFALSGDDRAQAQPVTRKPPALGEPMWNVEVTAPGLSFAWISSTKSYEIQGGTDATGIVPIARAVVAVEREGVAVVPGFRWVGSLLHWDGSSRDYRFAVRKVHEEHFEGMVRAQMAAVTYGRLFVGSVSSAAVAEAERLGHRVEITSRRPTAEIQPVSATMPLGGLTLHTDKRAADATMAENQAMRALGQKDWDAAVDYCLPFARASRACAQTVASAYKAQGKVEQACKWYGHLGSAPAGLCD